MEESNTSEGKKISSFSAFSHCVDARILRALADLGFARPTLVQAKAIPLGLEGRDILARARTGSGKTAAYCIPLLQGVINSKSAELVQATRALILVPTRELSDQVTKHLRHLLVYCDDEISVANVSSNTVAQIQRNSLMEFPDVIIGTPSRVLALVQAKEIILDRMETLVIDEADLIISYGHDEDFKHLMQDGHLPKIYQSFLMSATMTKDVESLKGLVLRNPVMLELDEEEDDAANLTQYVLRCPEVDKFLLTYVMLKLKLIKGKCILFVNDVDRCYRLKLFLEQFSIKSCVLNSELPLNSRVHIVQEFNKGLYDYIIATDESAGKGESDTVDVDATEADPDKQDDNYIPTERADDDDDEEKIDAEPNEAEASSSKKRKRENSSSGTSRRKKLKHRRKGKDKEYGVTRGIDFIDVACVLNFDLPTSSRGYTHRVGRTARAGRTGMALSFVVPLSEYGKNRVVGCVPSTQKDETIWERIQQEQGARGSKVIDYKFDKSKIEAFRYRMEDALRSVTRSAVREGRVKELKSEIINSDKLKAHFEDNPMDLEYLRHDKPLHPTRVQSHMKSIPKYLLPSNMVPAGDSTTTSSGGGFVPFRKPRSNPRGKPRHKQGGGSARRKKSDPLRKIRR